MGGDVEVITGGGEERQCTIYGAPDNSSTTSRVLLRCSCTSHIYVAFEYFCSASCTHFEYFSSGNCTHDHVVQTRCSRVDSQTWEGKLPPPLDGRPPSSSFLRCDIDKISPSLFTPPFLQLIIIRTNTCSDSTRLLQIGWRHFLCLISFSNT